PPVEVIAAAARMTLRSNHRSNASSIVQSGCNDAITSVHGSRKSTMCGTPRRRAASMPTSSTVGGGADDSMSVGGCLLPSLTAALHARRPQLLYSSMKYAVLKNSSRIRAKSIVGGAAPGYDVAFEPPSGAAALFARRIFCFRTIAV